MKTFTLLPAGPAALWVLVPALLVLALVAVPLAWLSVSMRRAGSVEVSGGAMSLNVPIYGRQIPVTSLLPDRARVVDLPTTREFRPRWRTNGVGLPGYNAGWFKLENGDPALLALTNQWRVLYLPTTDGYVLLLSVADPDGLLAAVRQVSGTE